jgi:hypothetical protein
VLRVDVTFLSGNFPLVKLVVVMVGNLEQNIAGKVADTMTELNTRSEWRF